MDSNTNSVPVIDGSWLRDRMSDNPASVSVLDATWKLNEDGKEYFLKEHIPGALHFDINQCVDPTPLVPRNIPDPEEFEKYVQSLGINSDTHVVVYDSGQYLHYAAARAWWTLRLYGHQKVSFLNGGLEKWKADAYDVATGNEKAEERKGNFKVKFCGNLMNTYEEVVEHVKNKSAQIVDTRRPEHFNAEQEEPNVFTIAALKDRGLPVPEKIAYGHHPNAINLREDLLFSEETNALLDKEDHLKLFDRYGIDMGKNITTTCYIGHGACILALALAACGKQDAAVYCGSWTEYGQRAPKEHVEDPRKLSSCQ